MREAGPPEPSLPSSPPRAHRQAGRRQPAPGSAGTAWHTVNTVLQAVVVLFFVALFVFFFVFRLA